MMLIMIMTFSEDRKPVTRCTTGQTKCSSFAGTVIVIINMHCDDKVKSQHQYIHKYIDTHTLSHSHTHSHTCTEPTRYQDIAIDRSSKEQFKWYLLGKTILSDGPSAVRESREDKRHFGQSCQI